MEKKQNRAYWLLTTEFPPQHGGGISTYCWFTARMLSGEGYDVTVFIPNAGAGDYRVSQENEMTLVRFDPGYDSRDLPLHYLGRLSYRFADVVKKMIDQYGAPLLIETQDYQGIAYYLLQRKRLHDPALLDVPVLITLHSPAFLYMEYNRIATYRYPDFWTCEMEKQAIATADLLISPTRFMAQEIRRRLGDSLPEIHIVENPFEARGEVEKNVEIDRGKIVCYGKLSVQKGSLALLKLFKELWDEGYTWRLHLVGGGDIVYHPEWRTMDELVARKYGDYISRGLLQLEGKIDPALMDEHVQDAQLIVFPSLIDNLPYAVMEMMSLGKAVLASVQGGQREIITDGVDGLLFDHDRKGDFKARLIAAMAMDPEALHTIGGQAKASVQQHYDPEIIFQKKETVIRDIITNHRQPLPVFPFLYQEPFAPCEPVGDDTLLSVVIPFYNLGPLLLEAVASVRQSRYPHIEIIVVNDGSTDPASLDLLRAITLEPDVQVIDLPNGGLANARNHGALAAKGNYLAFLDADDRVAPGYYDEAMKVLQACCNVFFVGCWGRYFGNSEGIWPAFTPQPPYLLVHNMVNSSALVYKRAAFLKAGMNEEALEFGLEDYESVIGMMAQGYNGVVLPDALFFYRVRENSMFRKLNSNKLLFSYKYIGEKYPAYFSKFSTEVIHLLNANGPGYLVESPVEEMNIVVRKKGASQLYNFAADFVRKRPGLKKAALKMIRLLN